MLKYEQSELFQRMTKDAFLEVFHKFKPPITTQQNWKKKMQIYVNGFIDKA